MKEGSWDHGSEHDWNTGPLQGWPQSRMLYAYSLTFFSMFPSYKKKEKVKNAYPCLSQKLQKNLDRRIKIVASLELEKP